MKNLLKLLIIAALTLSTLLGVFGCTTEQDSAPTEFDLTEGADVRVMSYNILHEDWSGGERISVYDREDGLVGVISAYKPDVIGLQEVSTAWHGRISARLVKTGDYERACYMTNSAKKNMTTLLYNAKTVKKVDDYVVEFDENSDIRVFSVAVFEKISDGKRFVVTNTHPAPVGQAEAYVRHVAALKSVGLSELTKYSDLPVIMTGDYNTTETSAVFADLLTHLGVVDAKQSAVNLVRNYASYQGLGVKAKEQENPRSLDHILLNNHARAFTFNTVIGLGVENISDHLPILADLSFV